MFTHNDILRIREWAEKRNAKIIFRFKNYPYILVIEKMIKSQDINERTVDWIRAFGTKKPHQVISSMPIDSITIYYKTSGEEEKLKNPRQLLQKATSNL